jgi:radical SAM superfamily enzyme YgiQ (UPF0313 family)
MPGYCLIRAFAEKYAPEWRWGHVEATVKTDIGQIMSEVESEKPEILLATGYIFNLELLLKVCSKLKDNNKKLQIYLGGPSFLGNNEEFLRCNKFISGVIRGDESSIPDLLHGIDDEKINGLCRIDEKDCYMDNGLADYNDEFDTLPSPYQQGIIHKDKAFYQLETSRGCGGACSFCTSSKSRGVKYHSVERVREDLLALYKYGYRDIRLIDRTFNENSRRAISLLKLFADEFPDMRFHLEIHPGRLKPDLLEQLAKGERGSLHIEAGIQSFDSAVLKNIRRPASGDKSEEGLKKLISLGNIEVHADLIAGLPGQTLHSLLNDIIKMLELSPDEIQLENLKLLPGTFLRENLPAGMKYNSRIPWEIIETNEMTSGDLEKASLYSYILDSWYNPPALQNVFVFCNRRISGFFTEFCEFIEPHCNLNKGKMPLEKRFSLLEKFLERFDKSSLELCRFAKTASGFSCTGLDFQKYSEFEYKTLVWQKPELGQGVKIKRCIIMDCGFNAADFWVNKNAVLKPVNSRYIFKLHYGRNVAEISEININKLH